VHRPVVVGVGRINVAFAGQVPHLPDGDVDVELDCATLQLGGDAAVAVGTAVALGCAGRLAGGVARDFLGAFASRALADAGIDVSLVRSLDRQLTPFSFTAVAGAPARRLTFRTAGDLGDLAPRDVDLEALLRGAGALLVDGAHPALQIAAAERARAKNVPVIFDGTQLAEGIGELVGLADVLISSEHLAAELAPRGELSDSLAELQRMGPRAVIITLGSAGSIGLHGDQLVEQPAFEVDCVDASGAGAVFCGAFATALLNELPFPRCLELATAASALSCRTLGPWAGIPGREDVLKLIRARHA
jgi:ribokinase